MSHFKQFKNVIIWGYPYGTHTQSYVWYGFYRAFKALGIETHWLAHNWSFETPTSSIQLGNTLFICERNDMTGMPLDADSTYLLHMMSNRSHLDISGHFMNRVKRILDMRQYDMIHRDDECYEYSTQRHEVQKLEPGCMFEKSNDLIDKIYVAWATDLLPHEINLDDAKRERESKVWFVGTVGGGRGGLDDCLPTIEKHDNRKLLFEFREACKENGVEFQTNCPWLHAVDQEHSIELIKKSYLAPDSRHPSGVSWGYIPCRVMKNISYGQIGLTNSPSVEKFLEGEVICRENGKDLFYAGLTDQKNYEKIQSQMKLIRDKHTYINRANSILKALSL